MYIGFRRFRGKVIEDCCREDGTLLFPKGAWVYGNLIYPDVICGEIVDMGTEYINLEWWVTVDAETIGECACMPDKNGSEIYSGDIIKTHYANVPKADYVEAVVFHCGGFKGEYKIDETGTMWSPLADGLKHLAQDKTMYMEWFEKIGNIHDNPELIKS